MSGGGGTQQPARDVKKIRVLVIQLARLGDTLQSLMALRAAKQLYPQLEIHMLVRERFSSAVKKVSWLAGVHVLKTDEIVGPLLRGQEKEREALRRLAVWVGPLVGEMWDLTLNWTYTEASSFLTGLIPARAKLGFSRRKDLSLSATDGWSHYIHGMVQGGAPQNIHLTDILTTQLLTALQIHYGEGSGDSGASVTAKGFFSTGQAVRDEVSARLDSSRRWVAIQLGAGAAAKTWSPHRWSELVTRILVENPGWSVVVLGGKEDQPRFDQFIERIPLDLDARGRVVSLVGATDFDLWAEVIGRVQWLIAGDTAAIHLASILGTRVINLSIGPVKWAETGPYGNFHYVIAPMGGCKGCGAGDAAGDPPDAHTCREAVSPDAVYAVWAYGAKDWTDTRRKTFERFVLDEGFADAARSVRIFRSRIRTVGEGGGIDYEGLNSWKYDAKEWMAVVTGQMARAWYCGWSPPIGVGISRDRISPELVRELRKLDESSGVLSKIFTEARATATKLGQRASRLKSDRVMSIEDRNELRGIAHKLFELEKLAERVGETDENLRPMTLMLKVMMHNLRGSQLSELGLESAIAYGQLVEGVEILRRWVRSTRDLSRPVSVGARSVLSIGAGPGPAPMPGGSAE